MTDNPTPEIPDAASPRLSRGRKVTIATLVTAGLATGGFYAAQGSFASGGSGGSGTAPASGPSVSAPANAPRPPAGPSANDLDGTVTAASSSSVTVRNEFGTSRTFAITDDTTVHNGRAKGDAGDLEVGQRVHVRAAKSGSDYTAKDIDIRPAHIGGTVASISGDTVTVTDRDGFTRTIALSSTTTFTKDGATADRGDLTGTSVIDAEGTVASNGTTLDATRVDIRTKAPTPPRGPAGGPGAPAGKGGPPAPGGSGRGPAAPPAKGKGTPPKPGTSGAPKAPSGAPKVPSGAPKAPSGGPQAPSSAAPSGGASSGS